MNVCRSCDRLLYLEFQLLSIFVRSLSGVSVIASRTRSPYWLLGHYYGINPRIECMPYTEQMLPSSTIEGGATVTITFHSAFT